MSVCPLVTVSVTSTGPEGHSPALPDVRGRYGNAQPHHPPTPGATPAPSQTPSFLLQAPAGAHGGARKLCSSGFCGCG